MKKFIITSKRHGEFTVLVDDEDWDRVMANKWSITRSTNNYFRVEKRHNKRLVRLHRFILGVTDPKQEIDHIDRDPLNNQKSNLRMCSRHENMRNIRTRGNKTGFRGVYRNHGHGKYRACISIKNRTYHIPGNFDSPELAAMARDQFALKVSKDFAVLNFKDTRGS